ncbi:ABC transporter ATP-binding protein [Bordetella bronchiseptica]|uniref:ABC transporter ATP-binding protein n=2 Tax=Bordetella bronchiseptica TaxID=518 RepID=A0A0C6P5W8_BORBO|nr:ABC transporter ATP-binding protein [Bordetella bronchiseptica]SHS02640.1 Probable o-antigen/lipopolysaccharide transport ATP-binding protein ABC transporter RfbE [Mycobacteroides abscessus subsp. abscessus]AWP73054.1 sugar ABC transporter ATP-binding protein [Bordetella bronchiseptica]AWP77862.1 sugar ABC transporter ATP-binding protein [Bordetella bronchiseptica]AZW19855.1 ABC transporter ATP-binding protein [Bordetella bronchiseptica]KCV35250.1 ABC transporter, ATP-binding protein [Borde
MTDSDLWIQVSDVRKHYAIGKSGLSDALVSAQSSANTGPGEKIAVDGISLTIRNGERLGIVGRNGAGKSTLLHMVAGLSAPTAGKIDVHGRVTAIMTLGLGLREHASGRENIYIDGEVQGKSRVEIDAVIDEIIEFAELGEFIDMPVRTYSTGMKSRLAFAMISCLEPEILIIDEALSAGDAKFSAKATRKIQEICAKGRIVILVSHSMASIQSMCNRCLWIDQGKIVMDGLPDQVCKAYIDAVRSEDEAKLLERFRDEASTRFSLDGWDVDALYVLQGDTATQRVLLEAGEDALIRTKIQVPTGCEEAQLVMSVTRLDGLVVTQRRIALDKYTEAGVARVQFAMRPLVLGQGVYRLEIAAELDQALVASRSMIFEVFVRQPPTGGVPMLLYPSEATASLLS